MQSPTHFLIGILIYDIFNHFLNVSGKIGIQIIVFILAFFSHYLIDGIAKITYHVPDPQPQDKFWVSYHIGIALLTVFFIIYFWNPYILVMVFSSLIDIIDWIILRMLFKKKPIFHPSIDKFRDKVFGWLPTLIEKKWTVINEILILLALGTGIYLL